MDKLVSQIAGFYNVIIDSAVQAAALETVYGRFIEPASALLSVCITIPGAGQGSDGGSGVGSGLSKNLLILVGQSI